MYKLVVSREEIHRIIFKMLTTNQAKDFKGRIAELLAKSTKYNPKIIKKKKEDKNQDLDISP